MTAIIIQGIGREMKITRKQIRKIIKESRGLVGGVGFGSTETGFNSTQQQNRPHYLKEQPIGAEQGRQMQLDQEFRAAESTLMSILGSMDPVNRNANIYSLIDELEDLASRG